MSKEKDKETLEALHDIAYLIDDTTVYMQVIVVLLIFIAVMLGVITYYLVRYVPFP